MLTSTRRRRYRHFRYRRRTGSSSSWWPPRSLAVPSGIRCGPRARPCAPRTGARPRYRLAPPCPVAKRCPGGKGSYSWPRHRRQTTLCTSRTSCPLCFRPLLAKTTPRNATECRPALTALALTRFRPARKDLFASPLISDPRSAFTVPRS